MFNQSKFDPDVPGQITVIDLKNDLYQIHHKHHGMLEGTYNKVFWEAVKWGVDSSEMRVALSQLSQTGNTHADMGIFGNFILTFNDEKVG